MDNSLYEGKTDHDLLIMLHTRFDDMEKRMNRFDLRFWGLLAGLSGAVVTGIYGFFDILSKIKRGG